MNVKHISISQTPRKKERSPLALKAVAFIFLLFAISAALDMFVAYTQGTSKLSFGILHFFLYLGLLAHRPYARTIALLLIGFGIILYSVVAIMLVVDGIRAAFDPIPEEVLKELGISNMIPSRFLWWSFEIEHIYAFLFIFFWVALLVWMRHVLLRPHIKALFIK